MVTYVVMAFTTEESSYCDPDCWMRRSGSLWPMVEGGICRFCRETRKGPDCAEGTQSNGRGIPKGHGSDKGPFGEASEDFK